MYNYIIECPEKSMEIPLKTPFFLEIGSFLLGNLVGIRNLVLKIEKYDEYDYIENTQKIQCSLVTDTETELSFVNVCIT